MSYGKVLADIKHINTPSINRESFNQTEKQILFMEYFNNPVMTKINDEENSSHYYAKVNTSLISESRYLIVIVNRDNNKMGYQVSMRYLNWISLQMRTLRNDKNVNLFNYTKGILFSNLMINKINKTESYTQYSNTDLGLNVYVFHTKNNLSYPDNVSLQSAIEMYQTIIN